MGMFKPASATNRKLKVFAYGPPGVGKTVFALSFAAAGKLAVIDTEGSTSMYGGRHTFDVLHTKDFAEVMRAVAEMKADNGKVYQALVIDPITVLWGTLQEAGQELVNMRTHKTGVVNDATLSLKEWGIIKRQYNRLMTELVNLNMHVVLTARQKEKTDQNGNSLGITFDGEKNTPYLPDIILRFTGEKGYTAIVEKDRSGLYPMGTKLEAPNFATFRRAISEGAQVLLPSDDAGIANTARLLEEADALQTRQNDHQTAAPTPVTPSQGNTSSSAVTTPTNGTADPPATERQTTSIRKLCMALGRPEPDFATLTFEGARGLLTRLSAAYSEARNPAEGVGVK